MEAVCQSRYLDWAGLDCIRLIGGALGCRSVNVMLLLFVEKQEAARPHKYHSSCMKPATAIPTAVRQDSLASHSLVVWLPCQWLSVLPKK
jgi:hypothetical protein